MFYLFMLVLSGFGICFMRVVCHKCFEKELNMLNNQKKTEVRVWQNTSSSICVLWDRDKVCIRLTLHTLPSGEICCACLVGLVFVSVCGSILRCGRTKNKKQRKKIKY